MDSTNFAFQGKFYIIKGQISELIALRLKSLDRLIWMSYVTYRWGMIFSLGKLSATWFSHYVIMPMNK